MHIYPYLCPGYSIIWIFALHILSYIPVCLNTINGPDRLTTVMVDFQFYVPAYSFVSSAAAVSLSRSQGFVQTVCVEKLHYSLSCMDACIAS
jgi:hypothetical protein